MIQPREARLFNVSDVRVSTVDKHTNEGEQAVRLCNYVDVYKNEVILNDFDFMPATCTPDEIARFRLAPGDVVFTKDSETADDIGIPAFVKTSAPDLVCGYHVAIATPHQDLVDPKFLFWYLNSRPAFAWWETRASGVTRVGLRQEDIRHLPLGALPPMSHQRAIADFLDRETAQIDAMIEAQEVLILRISEYDSAWRAYAVLPLLGSGDRLKTAMFETEERANDAADSLPLLSVSIDWGVRRRDETSTNQAASEDLSKYKVVCKGDIVLNRMRAFQGALGHSDEDGIVSPDYAVFRAREGVNPEWLSSIMRSAPFIEEMASRIRGIGSADSGQVRTPRLNARDLLDIRLALPSQAAQEDALADWRERTGEVERVLDAASEGVRLLRERRDALITAAVTGRIDPATGVERSDPTTEREAS
ncbi:hypothetical protein TESS_TESS_02104 [Tessaracoccus sp. O5.2]|uniref:restriction endonuclease subunit S n=1 Tax=Tessaracoccus sp. O5.2 TaxID=3157622 RepID=UPI0035EDD400